MPLFYIEINDFLANMLKFFAHYLMGGMRSIGFQMLALNEKSFQSE